MSMTTEQRLAALEREVVLLKAQVGALLGADQRTGADLARETAERFKDIPPEEWPAIEAAMRAAREELNRPVEHQ